MKIHLAAIGKPRRDWVQQALKHYRKFLAKYGGVEIHFVTETRLTKKTDLTAVRRKETEALLRALPDRATRIFLDQTGKQLDSIALASALSDILQISPGPVGLCIGGPAGLDLSQKRPGDQVWALSQLTFPHKLALIIALEQLARALSIQRGDSYHR